MSKDIVVIGASTGGLEALKTLVRGFPHDLKAACFVVWHICADSPGILATVLGQAGVLPAVTVWKSESIALGKIYVAAPDRHLLLSQGIVYPSSGPKENQFRPAVDPLFRTAAHSYRSRVIGIVLTGALNDGTQGLSLIKKCGGTAVVQDPKDAVADSMPRSALARVDADYCLPVAEIAALLVRLSKDEV